MDIMKTLGAVADQIYNALASVDAATGINSTEFSRLVGIDVIKGKTPIQVLQDVIDHADVVFPNVKKRATAVQVLGNLLFWAKLDPTHTFG